MAELRGPALMEPVSENLRELSDGISKLVKEHVELAKVEMRANAKRAALDLSLAGVGAGLLVFGWVLAMFAAGYALADSLGNPGGFLVIAGCHVLVGLVLAGVFGSRLMREDKLRPEKTRQELAADRRFLSKVQTIVREPHRAPA